MAAYYDKAELKSIPILPQSNAQNNEQISSAHSNGKTVCTTAAVLVSFCGATRPAPPASPKEQNGKPRFFCENIISPLDKSGSWNSGIFSMIRNLSETVIVPIAGIILTFVMCYELIQLIIEKNNLHDFDTWIFWKWIFKTFCAVLIVTNTWNIVMGVFDVAQSVVNQSAGVIIADAGIDITGVIGDLGTTLASWSIGGLLGLWFQSIVVGLCTHILSICIFLVIYGRMIEIYLVTSIGPIPFATMVNREWGSTGQNYLRSLLALGFQAFLIMICVGIYAVLVQNIAISGDNVSGAIWGCMGYTVLLCYTLFKTGSLAKSLFGAH